MNSAFTPLHPSIKTKPAHALSHNTLKHILSLIIYGMPVSLTGQIATQIIRTSDSTALVTVLDSGNVGIGVSDPLSRLHVAGTVQALGLKMTTGAVNNHVLTSDGNGVASWQPTQLVGIGGSGASGYLSKFNGTTTLGNSVLYQDGDGELGIGTLTPDRPFVISGIAAAIAIRNQSTNGNPSLFMQNDMRHWQIFIDGGNNMTDGFAIRDVNAGMERFIIDTDGDVAIGDFNPTSKLHVGGTVRAMAFTSSSPLLLQTNGTTRIFVHDTTGNVGIATTSPQKRLHIKGQGVVAHSDSVTMPRTEPFVSIDADLYSTLQGILGIYDRRQQTTLSPTPTVYIENANAGTDPGNYLLQVVAAGTSRLVVRQDGKVGIGTTSPTSLLHIAGTAEMTGFKLNTGASNNYVLTSDGSGAGTWQPTQLVGIGGTGTINHLSKFTASTTLGSSGMVEDISGRIGIGTSVPLQQLSIGNGYTNSFHFETATDFPTLHFGDGYGIYINYGFGGGLGFAFNGSAGTGVWGRFLVDGSELMRLTASGDLGIGTDNPQAKLHVEGTTQMTGFKMGTGASNNYVLTSDGSGTGTWQPTQLVGISGSGTSGYLSKFNGTTTLNSSVFYQDGDGDIGIGTEVPLRPLHIYSSIAAMQITNPTTNSNPSLFLENDQRIWQVFVDGGNSGTDGLMIRDGNAGQDRLLINTSGDVGIGTSSPLSKLHVAGAVRASAFTSSSPLLLQTNGTTRIYVDDATGNVGIGTTTPQQLLVLRGAETMSGEQFQITNTSMPARTWGIGVNGSGGFTIRDETGLANPISISAGAATGSISIGTQSISLLTGGISSFIKLSTNATERMRIDVNGNTGIGTTTPAEKLDVAGNVQMTGFKLPTGATNNYVLTSDTSGVGTWQEAPGANTSGTMNYISKFINANTLGNSGIFEDGSGNIGIGTTTPQQKLVIQGDESMSGEQFQISTASGTKRWGIGVNSSSGGLTIRDEVNLVNPISIAANAATGSLSIGTNSISLLTGGSGSHIRFSTNATERMRIDHSGNVGIGTTSPAYRLDIAGGLRSSSDIVIGPGTDKTLWFNTDSGTNTRARIGFYFNDQANKLDLATIVDNTETARIIISQDSSITFRTANAEAMRIDSAGNVGIGADTLANILTIKRNSATDPIADMWSTYSSRRWKTNVATLDNALSHVMQLRGVSYQWKADGKRDIGFIAEEVGEIYPEIVAYEENGIDAKSVDYSRLVPVLVEAMKEQQAIIAQQRSELDSYSARLEKLEQLLNER